MTKLRFWAMLAALVACLLGTRRAEAQTDPASQTTAESADPPRAVRVSRELGNRPCENGARTCVAWDVGGNAQIGRFFLRAQELVERTSGRHFIERRDWWNWRLGDMRHPFDPRPRRSGDLPPILNRSGEAEFVSLELLMSLNDGSTVGNSMMASAYCGNHRAYPLRFGTSAMNRRYRVTEPVTLENVERLMPSRCRWAGVSLIDGQTMLLPTTGGLTVGQRIDALVTAGVAELDAGRASLSRILQDSQAYSALANRPHVVVELERRTAFENYRTRGMQLAATAEETHERERANLAARVRDLEARLGGHVPPTPPASAETPAIPNAPVAPGVPAASIGNSRPPAGSSWRFGLELAMGLTIVGFAFQKVRDRNHHRHLPKEAFDDLIKSVTVRTDVWSVELKAFLRQDGLQDTDSLLVTVPQVRHLLSTLNRTEEHRKELFAKIEEIGKENERLYAAMPMVKTDLTGVTVSKDMLPPEKADAPSFQSPAEAVRQSMTDVGTFSSKLSAVERRASEAEKTASYNEMRAQKAEDDRDAWKKRAEAAEPTAAKLTEKKKRVEELEAEVASLKTKLEEEKQRADSAVMKSLESPVARSGAVVPEEGPPVKPLNGHAVPSLAVAAATSASNVKPISHTIPGPAMPTSEAAPMPDIPKAGNLPSIFADDEQTDVRTMPNLDPSGRREHPPQPMVPTDKEGDER